MSGQLLSGLNAAARLVFSAMKSDHVSPLLHELHWLRVPGRIRFLLCVLIPLPQRHCVDISRRQPPSNRCRRRSSVVAVYALLSRTRWLYSTDEPLNPRRPCVPSGCIKSVERLAFLSHSRFITVDVSSGSVKTFLLRASLH